MLYVHSYDLDTPFGEMAIAAADEAVTAIWFAARARQAPVDMNLAQRAETPLIRETAAWIRAYFDGKRPDPSAIPVDLDGSEFRKEVLRIITTVPYGQVINYGEIAREIARRRGIEKMAAQAVGGAVASNKVLLLIPCHRVIGAHGTLGGYNCGLDIKRWLLKHERE
ncbi:MAG: methylated-DNA--[protein]-cysteine S-methyltransferase [Lachnospiraceae bacterium]|nr:methylated-DNA--[protein]-cysteine S-methyltransferase [Lachnospiraceae bacterium]